MDELEFCTDLEELTAREQVEHMKATQEMHRLIEKFDQRDASLESLFRQDPGVAFALSLPDLFVLRDRVEGAELHVVQMAINDKRDLAIALKRAKMRKDWTADFDNV